MTTSLRVLFLGTPEFSVPTLKTLIDSDLYEVVTVITQPDRPAGRGSKLTAPPVKTLAQSKNIPVLQPERIKKELESFLVSLEQHEPFDVGVVIAFGQILPVEVLNFPKHGCINIHASLLPRWRGAAPIQRAIMAGDAETGVCLMKMEAGLDTGPVYSSDTLAITAEDSFGTLHDKLATLGAELLLKDLKRITDGTLSEVSQPEDGVTYADKISKEEASIDWDQDCIRLRNKIHGLSPFPGAFTRLNGKRLKIFKVETKQPLPGVSTSPGSIQLVEKDRLEVTCKDGALSLLEVQYEGKKRMEIEEFLKGVSVSTDTVLS